MTSSEGFQQYFSIISNYVCCGFYMKKNVAFTLLSSAVLKWDDYLSVAGSDTGSVASRARTELTSTKFDWTREFELSRM